MVKGLNLFRERFRPFQGLMTLIGGAACDEWFTTNGLTFRATNDLDLVIMMDDLDPAFISAIRAFVAEGGYEISERSEGVPILYRFSHPARDDFPAKLELSSRKPDRFELSDGQKYIPISAEMGRHSLSAILLDDAYFGLIQAHHDERDGYGLDKAARLEAQQQEEQAAVPELEPEFPFTVVVFDPAFFGVAANPSGVNGG